MALVAFLSFLCGVLYFYARITEKMLKSKDEMILQMQKDSDSWRRLRNLFNDETFAHIEVIKKE